MAVFVSAGGETGEPGFSRTHKIWTVVDKKRLVGGGGLCGMSYVRWQPYSMRRASVIVLPPHPLTCTE